MLVYALVCVNVCFSVCLCVCVCVNNQTWSSERGMIMKYIGREWIKLSRCGLYRSLRTKQFKTCISLICKVTRCLLFIHA